MMRIGGDKRGPLVPEDRVTSNPLHALCRVALGNLMVADAELAVGGNGPLLTPWAGTFASEPFTAASDGEALYDSVEFAGEAALYRHLNADGDLEILFAGALGWQVRGIDAIARRKSDGVFILCEAKGSSKALAGSPLAYLGETKTKGRQFGWQWCWNSLIDMAEHPATAAAFLVLLEPLLGGEMERLLAMTRATKQDNGWRIAETRVFPEARLREYSPLARPYPLDKQRRMLAEIAATPDGAALLKAAAGYFNRLEAP